MHAVWLQVTGPGRNTLPKGNKDITNQIFSLITHKYLNLAWRVIFRKRLIVQIITILLVKTLNHKNQWRMCNILPLCVEINSSTQTHFPSCWLMERCWWVQFYPQKCICNTYRNHIQACKNKIWLRGKKMCLKCFWTVGGGGTKLLFVYQNKKLRRMTLQVVEQCKNIWCSSVVYV